MVIAERTAMKNKFAFLFVLAIAAIPSSALAFTLADGINDRGKIVGFYGDVLGTFHGFLVAKGTFTTIDVPGSTSTLAFGINGRGQIVGQYKDVGGMFHGYRLDKGTFTTIDV